MVIDDGGENGDASSNLHETVCMSHIALIPLGKVLLLREM